MRFLPLLLGAVGLGGPPPGSGAAPDLDVRHTPDFDIDRQPLGTPAHVVRERTGGVDSRGYIHRSQAKRRKMWRRSPALRVIQGGGRKRR